jgi:hypothetical protein
MRKNLSFTLITLIIYFIIGSAANNSKLIIDSSDVSRQITYVKDKDEIGIVDLKGKIIKQIKDKNTANASLTWSPDGSCLSYIQSKNDSVYMKIYSPKEDTIRNICMINIDTLDNLNVPVLKWCKNGKYIYFSDNSGINMVDLNGKKESLAHWDAIRDFEISPDDNTIACTNGDSLFTANLIDHRVDSASTLSYNFDSITKGKINRLIFLSGSNEILLAAGKNIILLNTKHNEYRNIYKASAPIYWIGMDPGNRNIYYLSGVPTIHRELKKLFDEDMFIYFAWQYYELLNRTAYIRLGRTGTVRIGYNGFPLGKMKQRVQGHFDLCKINMEGKEYERIETRNETVTSVMPDLSEDGKYVTLILNKRNSLKKLFIISTENKSKLQLTKKGYNSFPTWRPIPK